MGFFRISAKSIFPVLKRTVVGVGVFWRTWREDLRGHVRPNVLDLFNSDIVRVEEIQDVVECQPQNETCRLWRNRPWYVQQLLFPKADILAL